MKPKRQGKITVTYRPDPQPPPVRPFDLSGGWVEIWEHGKYLGLLDSYAALVRFVCRRPTRRFAARFVQRELCCGMLRPIGSFGARATEDGQHMELFNVRQLTWED